MVAVREAVEVLAEAVTVTVPSLFPEAGDTVNHDALLPTAQLVLDEMEKVRSPPSATKSNEEVDTANAGIALKEADRVTS